MALDFTQIDDEGIIINSIPIGIDAHAKIFDLMEENRYPFLERIRDYYSDVQYSLKDLPGLRNDLTILRQNHLDDYNNLKLLDSMIKLVNESISKELKIETIAD